METIRALLSAIKLKFGSEDAAVEHLNDITVEENQTLHAWYVLNTIKKLENRNLPQATIEMIKRDFYWAFSWENKIKRTSMQSIEEHLRQVCDYRLQRWGSPYQWAWLLYFDETLYDRLVAKHFQWLVKKDAKQAASDLRDI